MAGDQWTAPAAHDLLRIREAADLCTDAPPPPWVERALGRAPWVVVRHGRVGAHERLIPVGVRGATRDERFATFVHASRVLESVAPERLAMLRAWRTRGPGRDVPALGALELVAGTLDRNGLRWGPTGSVGFELASGVATVTCASDLDLLVRAPSAIARSDARALAADLSRYPVHIDVRIETPRGAVSLAEYASGADRVMLRTAKGPCLVIDPWAREDA